MNEFFKELSTNIYVNRQSRKSEQRRMIKKDSESLMMAENVNLNNVTNLITLNLKCRELNFSVVVPNFYALIFLS